MLSHLLLMKLVSLLEDALWKIRSTESGMSVMSKSKRSKMKDSIFYSLPSTKERRNLRRSMLLVLKKSVSRRLRTRKELLLRSRGNVSRSFVRCTKPVKELRSKESRET